MLDQIKGRERVLQSLYRDHLSAKFADITKKLDGGVEGSYKLWRGTKKIIPLSYIPS